MKIIEEYIEGFIHVFSLSQIIQNLLFSIIPCFQGDIETFPIRLIVIATLYNKKNFNNKVNIRHITYIDAHEKQIFYRYFFLWSIWQSSLSRHSWICMIHSSFEKYSFVLPLTRTQHREMCCVATTSAFQFMK